MPRNDDAPDATPRGLPPAGLRANPKRQAIASIGGTLYQIWASIETWLSLTSPNQALYLEGAEDFDIAQAESATSVQVKRRKDTISLAKKVVVDTLDEFWNTIERNPTRDISFHYLTTSTVATESDASFGGLAGIDAWRVAQSSPQMAGHLARYLVDKLKPTSPLRSFLSRSGEDEVQERFIRKVSWLTNQPDIREVIRNVDNRIASLLASRGRSISLTEKVRVHLLARVCELLFEEDADRRYLTVGELLQQVEVATTAYLPVEIERVPEILAGGVHGSALLDLLLEKAPEPPIPLLKRPELVQELERVVVSGYSLLLTGTVHKGKTTLAQLVTASLCPEAWWINLTGRELGQVDTTLLALAKRIESGACPKLVVVDDLDVSPSAQNIYSDTISVLLRHAKVSNRVVLMTARGTSVEFLSSAKWVGVEIVDVPNLSVEEVRDRFIEFGCPTELSDAWAALVHAQTTGHPKLVQVRLDELVKNDWPHPGDTDLLTQSSAVTSVRTLTRQLLSSILPPETVELVYTMSHTHACRSR